MILLVVPKKIRSWCVESSTNVMPYCPACSALCVYSAVHREENRCVQQLDNLEAQKAEEEARVERMQQDLNQLRTDLVRAEKEAVGSQRSLLVLQEKFADAESALQGLKAQLCEVGHLFCCCA